MYSEIEKLKGEKAKLMGERNQIDQEINRINGAIKKFLEGLRILSSEKKQSAAAEIEKILRENGKPLHLRQIITELENRGFSIAPTSVSATLQVYTKRKKYEKVAPATFALPTHSLEA